MRFIFFSSKFSQVFAFLRHYFTPISCKSVARHSFRPPLLFVVEFIVLLFREVDFSIQLVENFQPLLFIRPCDSAKKDATLS